MNHEATIATLNMQLNNCAKDLYEKDKRIAELERQVASAERRFVMACEDLGLINENLGLDPDDGGAEPILEAIAELRKNSPDLEAIGWAYKTLLNMGYGGTSNQNTALMLDRLNLMLLAAAPAPGEG